MNVLIYAFFNKKFRQNFLNLFSAKDSGKIKMLQMNEQSPFPKNRLRGVEDNFDETLNSELISVQNTRLPPHKL